jgi:hypothetical protein
MNNECRLQENLKTSRDNFTKKITDINNIMETETGTFITEIEKIVNRFKSDLFEKLK